MVELPRQQKQARTKDKSNRTNTKQINDRNLTKNVTYTRQQNTQAKTTQVLGESTPNFIVPNGSTRSSPAVQHVVG
jgi:hypothetical protein